MMVLQNGIKVADNACMASHCDISPDVPRLVSISIESVTLASKLEKADCISITKNSRIASPIVFMRSSNHPAAAKETVKQYKTLHILSHEIPYTLISFAFFDDHHNRKSNQ